MLSTAALQLGKHFGAHMTAVCKPEALELARSRGADEVIDSPHEDFTKNGRTYDVIVDAVGKHHRYTFRRCKRSLNPGGLYLPTDRLWNAVLWLVHKRFGDKRSSSISRGACAKADVLFLKQLIEAGDQPVIDRVYPLDQAVEAHRYVNTGHKTGNVVRTLPAGDR